MTNDPTQKAKPNTILFVFTGVIAASTLTIAVVLVMMVVGGGTPPPPDLKQGLDEIIAQINERAKKEKEEHFELVKQQMDAFQKKSEEQNEKIAVLLNSPQNTAQVEALQKANDELKKQLEDFLASQKKHEEEVAEAKEKAPSRPPPPPPTPPVPVEAPPPPKGPEGVPVIEAGATPPGQDGQSTQNMKKFAAVVGVLICVAQPEFCPFAAALATIFGGGDTRREMASLKTLTDIAAGRTVSDAEVDVLMQHIAAKGSGEDFKHFEDAIQGLRNNPKTRQNAEQIDRANERLKANPVVQAVVKAASDKNASCDAVKNALEQKDGAPVFATREQKDKVRLALREMVDSGAFEKFWTGCLDGVGVASEMEK